jgi:hypothetical protein
MSRTVPKKPYVLRGDMNLLLGVTGKLRHKMAETQNQLSAAQYSGTRV